jgi:hypothetical protein
MTIEHKLVVGLEEIQAVVFECTKCKARIILTPENVNEPPRQCPRGHTWEWSITEQYETITGSIYVFFLRSLKRIREDDNLKMNGFKVLLEFEEPSN